MSNRDRIGVRWITSIAGYGSLLEPAVAAEPQHDRRRHYDDRHRGACKLKAAGVVAASARPAVTPSDDGLSETDRCIRDYQRSRWARPCGEYKPRTAKGAAKWTE